MHPTYLKIQNFLSFKDQEYTFDTDRAYLIQGVNNSKDSQASNGSGKSSLQSAIEYAITKTTSRKCRDVNLIRRGQESSAFIELHILCPIRKETLKIIRTIPIKGSTTCEVYVNDSKVTLANVLDSDNYILDWIGIEKEDLQNYFIINRERYTSFFSSSNTKKLTLVSRFSNTSQIDKMVENVLVKVSEKEDEIKALEDKISSINSKIELLDSQILKEQNRNIKEEIKTEVEKLQKKNQFIKYSSTIRTYWIDNYLNQKIQSNNNDIAVLNSKLSIVSKELENLKNASINSQIEVKKKQDKEQQILLYEITEIKDSFDKKITAIDSEIKKLNITLSGSITCPKCKHEFLFDDRNESVDDIKSKIQNLERDKQVIVTGDLKETELLLEDTQKEIDSINKSLQDLRKQENENDIKINNCKKSFVELESYIGDLKRKGNKYKNLQDSVDQIIKNNTLKIKNNLESIKSVQSKDNKGLIIELKLDHNQLQIELKSYEADILIKQNEKSDIAAWETNFKKFKSYLAQKSLLTIQAKINEQLKLMKSDLRIKLEGFKQKADGTLKEEITPLIIDNGEVVEFSALSGGERVRVDFSTILVLQEIINSTHKYGGLNLLFVDEITEGVDPLGISLLMKSMPKNKSIFVITHIQMDSMYEYIVTIENNNGISTIKK